MKKESNIDSNNSDSTNPNLNTNSNLTQNLPPKIILITNKVYDNPNFQPAEEILSHLIIDKLGLTYEKIEYDGSKVNNIFGKLPVLYYDGKIIINKNIPHFLKDLFFSGIENLQAENSKISTFSSFFDLLIHILKNKLSFSNEYYYYQKVKEKIEKAQEKRWLAKIKSFLFNRENFELIANNIINSYSNITDLSKMYLPSENRTTEMIKNAFNELYTMIPKIDETFPVNNFKSMNEFLKLAIYSFLKEDKFLFTKIKRPAIENLKYEEDRMFSNIGVFYKQVEDNIVKNSGGGSVKFNYNSPIIKEEICKKYSIMFNPKNQKRKTESIQEYQARTSFYHHLFSIAMFSGVAIILYYVAIKKGGGR